MVNSLQDKQRAALTNKRTELAADPFHLLIICMRVATRGPNQDELRALMQGTVGTC